MALDRVNENKTAILGGALLAFFLLVWLFRHLARDS